MTKRGGIFDCAIELGLASIAGRGRVHADQGSDLGCQV